MSRRIGALDLADAYGEPHERGGKGGRPLSATTVRLVAKILSSALNYAVDWSLIPENPAKRANRDNRLPARERSPMRAPTMAEFEAYRARPRRSRFIGRSSCSRR
jgi:hypothetical protein